MLLVDKTILVSLQKLNVFERYNKAIFSGHFLIIYNYRSIYPLSPFTCPVVKQDFDMSWDLLILRIKRLDLFAQVTSISFLIHFPQTHIINRVHVYHKHQHTTCLMYISLYGKYCSDILLIVSKISLTLSTNNYVEFTS